MIVIQTLYLLLLFTIVLSQQTFGTQYNSPQGSQSYGVQTQPRRPVPLAQGYLAQGVNTGSQAVPNIPLSSSVHHQPRVQQNLPPGVPQLIPQNQPQNLPALQPEHHLPEGVPPFAGNDGSDPRFHPQNPPLPPTINWGKCPQLEPKEEEKIAKAGVIRSCLDQIPLPQNLTQETVDQHRSDVAKCALSKENWFTADNKYKYEKAENEIKSKQLPQDIESHIVAQHQECKNEAEGRYSKPEEIITQVQLYQACMDYHISHLCDIRISASQ